METFRWIWCWCVASILFFICLCLVGKTEWVSSLYIASTLSLQMKQQYSVNVQAEENLNRLDPLVERLNASLSGFRYDRKSLANLIGGLQQFLETAFGLKAVQQKPFPKLPAKLFLDLSADGPVAISARLCAGFMKDKGLKRLDWTKTEFRRELVDVVSRVRQELIRAGYIQQPRVMILPSCPQEAKLRHAISKMGGQIVPQSEASAATHILHPFPPTGNPDDGQEYLRTLELRGGMARVHWWYLPDSYDEWIPSLSAPPDVDVDLKPPGGRPWQIYYRWVLDSEKYNEWMNEADYETEEAAAENKRLREIGDDEKNEEEEDISKERERKRSRIASAAAAEVSPGYVKALGPGAVLREKISTSRRFIDGGNSAVDLSFGQRQENSGLPVAATVPDGLRTTPAPYMLPAKSSWFDLDKVHDIETFEFPEFFGPSLESSGNQSEIYVRIRNAIVHQFKKDTCRKLALKDVWRTISEDFTTIRKVFDFLDRWGIINYTGPDRQLRAAAEESSVHPVGAEALLKLNRHPTPLQGAEAAVRGPHATARSGPARKNTARLPAIATGRRIYCAAYPDVDVTEWRYFCPRGEGVNISQRAFEEGRFPPGYSAKDFIRLEAEESTPGSAKWSDAEILLLLEGIESYGNNWDIVADHVGGTGANRKSPYECMMFFLQLRPEELALEEIAADHEMNEKLITEGSKMMSSWSTETHEALAKLGMRGPIPFAENENPTMATLSFIERFVDPRAAAEFALAAINVFVSRLEQSKSQIEVQGEAWVPGGELERSCLASAQSDAVAAGLQAAARRAQQLAEESEYEIKRTVQMACEWENMRIVEKLKRFVDIDSKDLPHEIERIKGRISNLVNEYKQVRDTQKEEEKAMMSD